MVHTTSLREQYLKISTCAVVLSNFDIDILFLKQFNIDIRYIHIVSKILINWQCGWLAVHALKVELRSRNIDVH